MERAEVLAECERLAELAREDGTKESFDAWREAEHQLVLLDQAR